MPLGNVTLHLPVDIGDYTDFFVGINHAFAVGSMFRGAENALQPNYRHLLVAYHGRASSVVVSKTPIRHPSGQILTHSDTGDKVPTFSSSRRLDIELELGAFICKASPIGQLAALGETSQYIFGYVLMNDWSACDIQVWEYVPLGPFNAKNFGTTISLWIVLLDALEPFSVSGIPNETELLPYLRETPATGQTNQHDIQLTVTLIAPDGAELSLHVQAPGISSGYFHRCWLTTLCQVVS